MKNKSLKFLLRRWKWTIVVVLPSTVPRLWERLDKEMSK